MNPHHIDGLAARNAEVIAGLDRALGNMQRAIDDMPLSKPAPTHLRLVSTSHMREYHRPDPAPMPRWLERLRDWAMALALGALLGITAGIC